MRASEVYLNGELFEYCTALNALEKFEFQVRLAMMSFSGYSNSAILIARASALFDAFVDIANETIIVEHPYEETIFKERSWFLTQPDGIPLVADTAIDVPYNASCYVRARKKKEIKHGNVQDVKYSTALKIRGIDPFTFKQPDGKNMKESLDCDIYSDVHRATYKASVKKLDAFVRFRTFDDVLELFPFSGLVFHLDGSTKLPKRDAYVTHRFKWENLLFRGIEMECSVDLRFRNEAQAYSGSDPYVGEFSCTVEREKIEDGNARAQDVVESLRRVFREFQLSTLWA